MIEIRDVRPGDAEDLLAHIRPWDLVEIEALVGPGQAANALAESIGRSVQVWTAESDGRVAWIFGVAPLNLMGDEGLPWMVGTDLVKRERRALTRVTPTYIARMLAVFPRLMNIVDVRNVTSIAWLRRAGFKVHPPVPVGPAAAPFHPFTMDA